MKTRGLVMVAAAAAVCTLITGCMFAQPVENEVTWAMKAATNQLTSTTPREWQAIVEVVDQAVPEADITLTDEQAQAIVDFIQANDLNSIQEIVELVQRVQQDPSLIDELVIPDSVMQLFGDYDFGAAVEGFINSQS